MLRHLGLSHCILYLNVISGTFGEERKRHRGNGTSLIPPQLPTALRRRILVERFWTTKGALRPVTGAYFMSSLIDATKQSHQLLHQRVRLGYLGDLATVL
jgi:hypothetical protein